MRQATAVRRELGHDFGADIAWAAAMMRADRIQALFGVSVPFIQPGGPSFLNERRAKGADGVYVFDQIAAWANAEIVMFIP